MTGTPETSKTRGWAILALCFVAMAVTFGTRSSVGILMPGWEHELGWARATISGGSSLVLAMMVLSAPLAGNLMDRHHSGTVLACGLALIGAAVLATSRISESWQFLLLFGGLGGLGFGAISHPMVSTAVARHFTARQGLTIGIAISGSTVGQLPMLSLLAFLATTVGWRIAYVGFGLVCLILAPAIWGLMRDRPPRVAPRVAPSTRPAAIEGGGEGLVRKLGLLARHRTFRYLAAAFMLCGFTTAGVVDVHFVPYAVSRGYTLVDSSAAYGVHGVFNMVGLIVFGWLADHVHRPRLLAGMFVARAATFVLLLYVGTDISLLFVFAAIFGLINFSTLPVVASMVASHIGVRMMGLTLGLLFGAHSLGAAAGALMGGYLFDALGSYRVLWLVSLALVLLAAALTLRVTETRGGEEPPRRAAATA